MAAGEQPPQSRQSPVRHTLRLTFSYRGRSVQLTARDRVAMIPPPGESTRIRPDQSGFWIELRDARGRVLYQRVVQSPIRFDVEIFEDETGGTIRREPVTDPGGTFELLVPDLPLAQSLVLMSSPPEPERAAEAAQALARFQLRGAGEGQQP